MKGEMIMPENKNQYFVHVSVSRMDLEHMSVKAVRSDYDYVFTMSSDVPVDEMSESAIYKQLIGGLHNLVNGVPQQNPAENPSSPSEVTENA